MPQLAGPQHLIKLTEGILSAQYCQYIYESISKNLLHERLERGFSGFLNDISTDATNKLSALDLVHTKIASLLEVMFALQTKTTSDVFLDCISFFKALETILPHMSARIFHAAFHLNQFVSVQKKIFDDNDVMNIFAENGYPQQPINMEHLETCVECECENQLDQAMYILLKMAVEIPSPSIAWMFETENCKMILQEVKRLYAFRRTFESANSFLEHNYSFLQANSNQDPKGDPQRINYSHVRQTGEQAEVDTHCSNRLSDLSNQLMCENRLGNVKGDPRLSREDQGKQNRRSSFSSFSDTKENYVNQMPSNGVCFSVTENLTACLAERSEVLHNEFHHLEVNADDFSDKMDTVNVETQTNFTEDSDDYFLHGDHSYSSIDASDSCESMIVNRPVLCSMTRHPSNLSIMDEKLELSFCSDMEDNDIQVSDAEVLVDSESSCPERITSRPSSISESDICNGMENDQQAANSETILNEKDAMLEQRNTRRTPKRMLVVYVERLDVEKWLSKQNERLCTSLGSALREESGVQHSTELSQNEQELDFLLPKDAASGRPARANSSEQKSPVVRRFRSSSESDLVKHMLNQKFDQRVRRSSEGMADSSNYSTCRNIFEVIGTGIIEPSSQEGCEKNVEADDNEIGVSSVPAESSITELVGELLEKLNGICSTGDLDVVPVEASPDSADLSASSQAATSSTKPRSGSLDKRGNSETDSQVHHESKQNSKESEISNSCDGLTESSAQVSKELSTRTRRRTLEAESPVRCSPRFKKMSSYGKGRKEVKASLNHTFLCGKCSVPPVSPTVNIRKQKVNETLRRQRCSKCGRLVTGGVKQIPDLSAVSKEEGKRNIHQPPRRVGLRSKIRAANIHYKEQSFSSTDVDSPGSDTDWSASRNARGCDMDYSSNEESSQDNNSPIVPAKRCRSFQMHEVEISTDEPCETSPQSLSSRLSSSSSVSSTSTEQFTKSKHKLYTGAADKIMAISRRRLNEDCMELDSEIKSGPKSEKPVMAKWSSSDEEKLVLGILKYGEGHWKKIADNCNLNRNSLSIRDKWRSISSSNQLKEIKLRLKRKRLL